MSALRWIELANCRPLDPCGPILVTNNLAARDALGHMSHVWLVTMVHRWTPGERDINGRIGLEHYGRFTAFDGMGQRLRNLTHWADPFAERDQTPPVAPPEYRQALLRIRDLTRSSPSHACPAVRTVGDVYHEANRALDAGGDLFASASDETPGPLATSKELRKALYTVREKCGAYIPATVVDEIDKALGLPLHPDAVFRQVRRSMSNLPKCVHGSSAEEVCPECAGAPSDDPNDEARRAVSEGAGQKVESRS